MVHNFRYFANSNRNNSSSQDDFFQDNIKIYDKHDAVVKVRSANDEAPVKNNQPVFGVTDPSAHSVSQGSEDPTSFIHSR